MAKKSVMYNIYADLVNAVKDIVGAKYVFLKERPNTTASDVKMAKFIVVDLPVSINDFVIGGRKTMLETSGVFYLFVQARSNNTLDVNSMGDLVDSVTALFPVSGTYCVATNPVVRMTGSDGFGFQVTSVTFDLRCRWGAFESNDQ